MVISKTKQARFALCISRDEDDLLTLRRVYRVLPDENAASSSYIRVIDDEGEDYLYPAEQFVLVDFPAEIEEVLLRAD